MKLNLEESEVQYILDALLFMSSVDIIANYDDPESMNMVEIASKINEQSKVIPSDRITIFGDELLYDQKEITDKIMKNFKTIKTDIS